VARPVSTVLSRAPAGLAAPLVRVEVHLGSGLPAFALVGLPEAVVRESKERVRSAPVTSGFEFPAGRITVNLSPADLPKEGGRSGGLCRERFAARSRGSTRSIQREARSGNCGSRRSRIANAIDDRTPAGTSAKTAGRSAARGDPALAAALGCAHIRASASGPTGRVAY